MSSKYDTDTFSIEFLNHKGNLIEQCSDDTISLHLGMFWLHFSGFTGGFAPHIDAILKAREQLQNRVIKAWNDKVFFEWCSLETYKIEIPRLRTEYFTNYPYSTERRFLQKELDYFKNIFNNEVCYFSEDNKDIIDLFHDFVLHEEERNILIDFNNSKINFLEIELANLTNKVVLTEDDNPEILERNQQDQTKVNVFKLNTKVDYNASIFFLDNDRYLFCYLVDMYAKEKKVVEYSDIFHWLLENEHIKTGCGTKYRSMIKREGLTNLKFNRMSDLKRETRPVFNELYKEFNRIIEGGVKFEFFMSS